MYMYMYMYMHTTPWWYNFRVSLYDSYCGYIHCTAGNFHQKKILPYDKIFVDEIFILRFGQYSNHANNVLAK